VEFLQEINAIADDINAIQKEALDVDMLQPLIDLGYLTLRQCKPENSHRNTFLEIAVKQFRKDYETHQSLSKRFTFEPFDKEHYHYYRTNLNEIETSFIQGLVSFEENFKVQALPIFGAVTLDSRVIHYRLKLFGLYGELPHHGIDAPFTDESLARLQILKGFLEWKSISDVEILDWLGDLNILIDKIFQVLNKDTNRDKKTIYLNKEGVFNTNQLTGTPTETVECYYEFMTRLFQIHLWANGLYHGAIDGIIKITNKKNKNEFSVEHTIAELVENLNEHDDLKLLKKKQGNQEEMEDVEERGVDRKENRERRRKERKAKRRQRREIRKSKDFETHFFYGEATWLLETYWVNFINVLKYTKALQIDDNSNSITEMINGNDNKIDNRHNKIATHLFDENGRFQELVKNKVRIREQDFLNNTNRKIYYGIQQFKRIFRRIIGKLFKKIGDFFKKFFNIAKRIAIIVYQEVKEGIKVFIHGFSFLVGKRRITTPEKSLAENISEIEQHSLSESIVTKFDLDCDAKQFVRMNTTDEEINEHAEKCKNQMNSLAISLVVTAIVLKLILLLAASSVTFPKILLMIGKSLKKVKWKQYGGRLIAGI
jgi:hypothetical protein